MKDGTKITENMLGGLCLNKISGDGNLSNNL
jgi:hypothetical protein